MESVTSAVVSLEQYSLSTDDDVYFPPGCRVDDDDIQSASAAMELLGSLEARAKELEIKEKQVASLKITVLKTMEETKKEFARHCTWKYQDLELQNLKADTRELIVDRFESSCRWKRNEWETFKEECTESELELQDKWRRYRESAKRLDWFYSSASDISFQKCDLYFIECGINQFTNFLGYKNEQFLEFAQGFRQEREQDRLRKLERRMYLKQLYINAYDENMAEWEEYKRELRFSQAQVKICSSEAQKCDDSGNDDGRRQWEAQVVELKDHIEQLEVDIEDYWEGEEELRSDFYALCEVDEGLVDME